MEADSLKKKSFEYRKMDSNMDTLKSYYDKIFPSEQLFKWLSYGQQDAFSKREFSFTLDENVNTRYRSFENVKEFTEELQKNVPKTINIGAVYNIKPKLNNSQGDEQIVPLWKEFVFDIDMDDYNDLRTCCSKEEEKICARCWTVMKAAVRVLDLVLREESAYHHVMWVFSGSKGVQCWASDPHARKMTAQYRSSKAEKLTLVKGLIGGKRVNIEYANIPQWLWPGSYGLYHSHINRAIRAVKEYFVQYAMTDQGLLETPEGVERIMAMFPGVDLPIQNLYANEPALGESVARWGTMVEYCTRMNITKLIDEIMLQCHYPRFNAGVSEDLDHLLQSPFSVHPSTGRICVPFVADEVDDFDPFSVPTMEEVLSELAANNDEVMATSLGKYIKVFDDYVASLPQD